MPDSEDRDCGDSVPVSVCDIRVHRRSGLFGYGFGIGCFA